MTTDDRTSPCTRQQAEAWRDRHGDIWRLGPDGLMHTPETAPFSREHVEKKWGPLVPVAQLAASEAKPDDRTTAEWIRDLIKARQKAESELAALHTRVAILAEYPRVTMSSSHGPLTYVRADDLRAALDPVSAPSAPLSQPGSVDVDADAPQPGSGAQDSGERRG